jgi:hypothetical protein
MANANLTPCASRHTVSHYRPPNQVHGHGMKKWPKEKQDDKRTLSERAPQQESGRYRTVGTPRLDLHDSRVPGPHVPVLILNPKYRVGPSTKPQRRPSPALQNGNKRGNVSPSPRQAGRFQDGSWRGGRSTRRLPLAVHRAEQARSLRTTLVASLDGALGLPEIDVELEFVLGLSQDNLPDAFPGYRIGSRTGVVETCRQNRKDGFVAHVTHDGWCGYEAEEYCADKRRPEPWVPAGERDEKHPGECGHKRGQGRGNDDRLAEFRNRIAKMGAHAPVPETLADCGRGQAQQRFAGGLPEPRCRLTARRVSRSGGAGQPAFGCRHGAAVAAY